jgi:hypothetical protein
VEDLEIAVELLINLRNRQRAERPLEGAVVQVRHDASETQQLDIVADIRRREAVDRLRAQALKGDEVLADLLLVMGVL